jgi:hypothetical protein
MLIGNSTAVSAVLTASVFRIVALQSTYKAIHVQALWLQQVEVHED